ncbi:MULTISPECIES: DsrE family protein [unclassified Thioalkalivibrio]|uniref:DsrE family protein n=1 Tax=unclassified Thioalkalivibrio TaxID=2621013 RepID=UPI0003A7F4B6|nr:MULTISPECIES: DsrE family protein [unclassified Thioalkalivibrio]
MNADRRAIRPGWFLAGALLLMLMAGGATALLFGTIAKAPAADEPLRVVYHINTDDPELHLNALRNLQNHIDGTPADMPLEIKVLTHGSGISLLQNARTDPDLRSTVNTLKLQDVRFLVCGNTMETRGIEREALHEVAEKDVVPSGIVELTRLQRAGYTYIKP